MYEDPLRPISLARRVRHGAPRLGSARARPSTQETAPSAPTCRAVLALPRLLMSARIGAEAPERAHAQALALSVELHFDEPPAACRTASLDDTVCYARLTERLKAVCLEREYILLEELGYALMQAAKEACFPATPALRLAVTKLHPPLAEAEGGAIFILDET